MDLDWKPNTTMKDSMKGQLPLSCKKRDYSPSSCSAMRFNWALTLLFFSTSSLLAAAGFETPWGKDADLKIPTLQAPPPPTRHSPLISLATRVIRFHQEVLSPVDGPRSHFRPSSSQYMRLAIEKHGFLEGFFMGCDRLLRENNAEWVYQHIEIDGVLYKYDPVP